MTDTQLHTVLLMVSAVCITFLVGYDLYLGGDGAALASGLAALGLIGGFAVGRNNTPPPASGS